MYKISIVGNDHASCDGVKVFCKGTYIENDKVLGAPALSLGKDDYLEFNEAGTGLYGINDYIKCRVSIHKKAPNKILFLRLYRDSLEVFFKKVGDGAYQICVNMKTQNARQQISVLTGETEKTLSPETFYDIGVFVLDGELAVTVNYQVWLRRTFENSVAVAPLGTTSIGGNLNRRYGGITIALPAFSSNIREEEAFEELWKQLNSEYDEAAIARIDTASAAADAGLKTGFFVKRKNGEKAAIASTYVYDYGMVLRSQDNRYTYVDQDIYAEYLKYDTLNDFPIEERVLIDIDRLKVTALLFPGKALIHTSLTLSDETTKEENTILGGKFLERYLQSDFAANDYWYPVNFLYQVLRNGGVTMSAQRFSNGMVIAAVSLYGGEKSEYKYTVVLPEKIYQYYTNTSDWYHSYGAFASDYNKLYDYDGKPFGYVVPVGSGWMYYIPEWESCGYTRTYPGDPIDGEFYVNKQEGYEYLLFENAVAKHYYSKPEFVFDKNNGDPMRKNWRKDLGFPFCDFTGGYDFTDRIFARAFGVEGGIWRTWMYGEVFYKIAERAIEGGKSYGFAAAETVAADRMGFFKPSLSEYKTGNKKEFSKLTSSAKTWGIALTDSMLKRYGWDTLQWMWSSKHPNANGTYNRIGDVKVRIENDGCSIITLQRKNSDVEHTVVAYKVDGTGLNAAIYVKDCNAPFDPAQDSANPDATYIAFRGRGKVVNAITPYCTGTRPEYQSNVGYHTFVPIPQVLAGRTPRIPTPEDLGLNSSKKLMIAMIEGPADLTLASMEGNEVCSDGIVTNYAMFYRICDCTGKDGSRVQAFLLGTDDLKFTLKGTKKGDVALTVFTCETRIQFATAVKSGDTLEVQLSKAHAIRGLSGAVQKTGSTTAVSYQISQFNMPEYYIRSFEGSIDPKLGAADIESSARGCYITVKQVDSKGKTVISTPKRKRMFQAWHAYVRMRDRDDSEGGIGNRSLSVRQASKIFKCSESTVRKYCKDGTFLGAYKSKKKWVIPKQEMLDK